MIVSEDRCSCAILVEQDGQRIHLVFDDLGCLLDYRADHSQTVVINAFVHDYGTGQWTTGASAHYLVATSDKLSTPMGSGIVAFETKDRAEGERSKSGGEIATYDRLVERRRGWREARRIGSSGSP
jgi:copper chaperone NosL